ncbi:MAG: VOC family protein [Hyphomonadaceae bacterium]
MANAIGGIGIAVRDLAKAADFYKRGLGMEQKAEINIEHLEEIILSFGRGASLILMRYKDGQERSMNEEAQKICMQFDDVKSVVASIRAAGGEITQEPSPSAVFDNNLVGFARDPDGHVIELIQFAKK